MNTAVEEYAKQIDRQIERLIADRNLLSLLPMEDLHILGLWISFGQVRIKSLINEVRWNHRQLVSQGFTYKSVEPPSWNRETFLINYESPLAVIVMEIIPEDAVSSVLKEAGIEWQKPG